MGSGNAEEIPDTSQNMLIESGYANICNDIALENDIDFADKTLKYEYSYEVPVTPSFSMPTAVYLDDSNNEYEFYPNGELQLFSSDTGVSITEFNSLLSNKAQSNLEETARQFIQVLLPATNLEEYDEVTFASSNLTERVLFTKKSDTPYAETITVALNPDGSLSWLKNRRIFLNQLSTEQIEYFNTAYQEYAATLQTNGNTIDSYDVYYQSSGEGVIIAQYITVIKDPAGAYFTDVHIFELS